MWLTDGQPLKFGNDSGKAGELSKTDRGFFARPNSPRRTNTIPLSPVMGITFKKYTMQQFLLLRTPPRFFYRVHGLKHFTHTRSFACNAICFLVLYWHIPGARLFLSCYMYSMLKKYSFWRKKEKNFYFFVLYAYIRQTTKCANLRNAYLGWPRFYAPLW